MKIKFSHKYRKLHDNNGSLITSAKLLDVHVMQLENISLEFLAFDTDDGLFQLPAKGKYMALIFQKPCGPHLFPTLRRWTEEKERYYRSGIGQVFDVEYI